MEMPIDFYHTQDFEICHILMLLHLVLCILLMWASLTLSLTRPHVYGILELPMWWRLPAMIGFLWGFLSFPYAFLTHLLLVSIIWNLGGPSAGIIHLPFSLGAFTSFWYGVVCGWKPAN